MQLKAVPSSSSVWVSLSVLALVVVTGCSADVISPVPVAPDRCAFEEEVYPILARDCGFPYCHGTSDRFFQVWAPGRARLDAEATGILAPPTRAELERSYDRARSMLRGYDPEGTPDDALLLRKPLEVSAGGAGHAGRDALGRNVYASQEDPRWQTLHQWAHGELRCP
ncbi:MAG: hypothetical protein KF901_05530 [Myxococcales bacterium]|nr:hypothetical protein [Myxococcales bacterium]